MQSLYNDGDKKDLKVLIKNYLAIILKCFFFVLKIKNQDFGITSKES